MFHVSAMTATRSRFISTATQTSAARMQAPYLPDPRLRTLAWQALWLGVTLVLLIPAARGYSQWLGWLPLWLVGMPLSALWALHRFRLPRLPVAMQASRRPRRRNVQARRHSQRAGVGRTRRAA